MTIITNYYVRPTEEQDIPFLWEMLYASLHRREGDEPLPIESIDTPGLSKYVEDWGREGDFGYVAVDQQGKRLGSITLRFYTDQNAGYGYVSKLRQRWGWL